MNRRVVPVVTAFMVAALSGAVRTAPQLQPPRRDPMTARIEGQVVTAASNSPVRAGQVRAHNDDGTDRLVTTDEQGRFALVNLQAGRWTLTVTKAGYLTQRYGQRRPFGPGTPIDIAAGRRVTADFVLARAGAITGRVFDEFGEPVVAARVRVLRSQMRDGRRVLQPVGPIDQSDDTGAFRVYDLPAGEYFVSAARRVAPIDSPNETTFAPTYYPGTASVQTALRVAVGPGEEQSVNFPLLPMRTVPVSGTVLHADGTPASAYVNLIATALDSGIMAAAGRETDPAGTFTLVNAAPGDYMLSAAVRNDTGPPERGSVPVTIDENGLTGVIVYVNRGALLNATIVRDDGVTRPLPTDGIRLTAWSAPPDLPGSFAGGVLPPRAGRTPDVLQANLAGLIGRQMLYVDSLPPDWMVKSIVINSGVDATDRPFEFRGEQNYTARIVLTDRVTDLGGAVTSGNAPVSDATVVIFSDDQQKWTYPSRYVRTTTVERDGSFRVRGLPPDERYFVAAVDYIEDNEAQDADFLNTLRNRATAVTLREGQAMNVRLGLVQR
jgi:hypothetical protein